MKHSDLIKVIKTVRRKDFSMKTYHAVLTSSELPGVTSRDSCNPIGC